MDNGNASYNRFLSGDEQGFVEIVRDYKDGLILYLNGFVHDLYMAEELCEDTFVKLGIKKPKNNSAASFKTWLYKIARNTAIDYLRKNKLEISIEEIEDISDDREGLEELEKEYLKEERKIAVHRALSKINPEYARVIYLRFFEDFSNKEIAKIIKKSPHSVESLVYRAKLALKKQLEKENFVYEEL